MILIGNLGNDPDCRSTQSGDAVTNVSLALNESWKDKQTGETQERTEWVRVVFFKRLGEIAAQYLQKGSKIYIEGKLRTRKWQDDNGQDRYITEILANELQMLDSRNSDSQQQGYQQQRPQAQPPQQGTNGSYQQPPQGGDFDDHIPFSKIGAEHF